MGSEKTGTVNIECSFKKRLAVKGKRAGAGDIPSGGINGERLFFSFFKWQEKFKLVLKTYEKDVVKGRRQNKQTG